MSIFFEPPEELLRVPIVNDDPQRETKGIINETLEHDPNGVAPGQPGSKLDAGKPPVVKGVMTYFPRAIEAVAMVSAHGAKKYCWDGWRTVPGAVDRYCDAMGRHLIHGPENIDPKSGLLHAAHMAWNALAVLEKIIEAQEQKYNGIDRLV